MSANSNQKMWMTLQEAAAPDVATTRTDEFSPGAAEWPEGLSRRDFLRLAGVTIAAASLSSCRLPEQKIVPYTEQPEKLIPGRPLHYATTLRINGSPRGVVVTSNEGRPTHIAGNPKHPLSLGACDAWTTAALYDLYDPDRLQTPLRHGEPATWSEFQNQVLAWNGEWMANQGEGLCLLMAPLVSPTEKRMVNLLRAKFPKARLYIYDPVGCLATVDPSKLLAQPESLELAQAEVIFALESNFLFDRPDSLVLTREFSRRRNSDQGRDWSRLYVAESCPTITGAKADHRFAVAPQEFDALAAGLLGALQGGTRDDRWPWLGALTDDLRRAGARGLVVAGRSLSDTARQNLAAANALLNNRRRSRLPSQLGTSGAGNLADLVGRMRKGEVRQLFIFAGNPVFDAPADFAFGSLLATVPIAVHLSLSANETSAACAWVVNMAHDLEAWSDTEAPEVEAIASADIEGVFGIRSITQPLIAPLYEGKSAIDLLSVLTDGIGQAGYDLVRATWRQQVLAPAAFEMLWHQWLREGVVHVPQPAIFDMLLSVTEDAPVPSGVVPAPPAPHRDDDLWLTFRPDDKLWDGRHSNNGWLMELPDSMTKLTWDNALLISPALATKLNLVEGEIVALHTDGVILEAPVLLAPGHADRCVTLPLGYGRTVCGSVGKNVGVNAFALRTSTAPWFRPLDKIERTGKSVAFARTQLHSRIEGRDLLHVARVDEIAPVMASVPTANPVMPSLYGQGFPSPGHRWGLTLDLNSCIGCNACIIACQSENNIPVVGREQVYMGREMQWIRVDRYYEGSEDAPRVHFQPVPCMQCENAPCEVVCPVAATQHDDEGLNVMVYNRCVGTRYCSNNCPYKVRRFNFLFYNADIPETQRLGLNPNVTVRSRGVMEKCTYCVQRIEEARIAALRETRPLRGNDIITACQSACPAQAIVFGDLADPESAVSKNRNKPGHYAMLEELDTRPRTTYLEKRVNPNPALDPGAAATPAPPAPI